MELTCIKCPVGCRLDVTLGEEVSVSGNECKRGEVYAKEEVICPMRTLTTSVIADCVPVSVKTNGQIPKDKITQCLSEIKAIKLSLPVKIGSVVLKNVAGTGVDVVATRTHCSI